MKYLITILSYVCAGFALSSCSTEDKNIAEENLETLMNDIESNTDVSFEEVSYAYKTDSICIIHAIRVEDEVRHPEEYVMYVSPNSDDIFFTIDLKHRSSILSQFQTLRKKYKMTDVQFDRSVKDACMAYSNANLNF